MKKLLLGLILLLVIVGVTEHFADTGILPGKISLPQKNQSVKIVSEESVIINVVKQALPSVVTVGIKTTAHQQPSNNFFFNPLNPFSPFEQGPSTPQNVEQNIGSGFIGSSDGLIITNKHVVSDDQSTYQIITNDGKKYDVQKIYRDPLNDIAILKIAASGLQPLALGDSSSLELGQLVIAIGTPLGEFRNSVTHGIISGLGRGISAGSPYEGSVEKLDNVIQTDAAISPGNSGGPLLDSSGKVIGINTAIAQDGQNIGFAIPVNVIKDVLKNFNSTGQFERPYIGIRYSMIQKSTAILNNVPQGAYVVNVVSGSPADQAGIQADDIVTKIDSTAINTDNGHDLATIISQKKVGQTVQVEIWRSGKTKTLSVTLQSSS